MSNLDGAEEIFEQTSLRVNERTKHGKFDWAIPPNIERASASREKKKAPKKKGASKKKPPMPDVTARSPPSSGRPAAVGQSFTHYSTLIETCRQRANELALSRLELDRISGLPAGFSAKLLGHDGGGPYRKRAWPISLEALLGALGLKVVLIVDEQAAARTLALRTPVQSNQQRFGNVSRLTPKLLAPPAKAVGPPSLTIVPSKRRGSKYAYG
jgi:hypothetical protein